MPISRASSRRREVEWSSAGVRVTTLPECDEETRGFTDISTDCNNLATTESSECPYKQRERCRNIEDGEELDNRCPKRFVIQYSSFSYQLLQSGLQQAGFLQEQVAVNDVV